MPIKVCQDKQSTVNPKHLLNPHLYFKTKQKLSLKRGIFCLFEHFDEMPLFVNNFGMASKLKRYVLTKSDKEPTEKLFEDQPYVGPHGAMVKRPQGMIPLIG